MVITGLTRNQVAFTGSWVRIPPLPPQRASARHARAGLSFYLGPARGRRRDFCIGQAKGTLVFMRVCLFFYPVACDWFAAEFLSSRSIKTSKDKKVRYRFGFPRCDNALSTYSYLQFILIRRLLFCFPSRIQLNSRPLRRNTGLRFFSS